MLILKNCTFVDFLTEGYEGKTGDILIDGEKIVKIAPCGTDFGVKAKKYDVKGKTLLPGLIDLHCHLFYDGFDALMNPKLSAADFTLNAVNYANEFLKDGYTTVRDCGDNFCRGAQHLRDAVNKGKMVGPRIFTSGPIITSNWTNPNNLDTFACGKDGFREVCRKNFAEGADFVKLYGSASLLTPSPEPGNPILEPDEIEAAVLAAKRQLSYVSVHAHGAEAIDMCVKAGVHTIEHASLISEETLSYIDENKLDTALVYTLYAMDEVLEEPDSYNGKRLKAIWDKVTGALKNAYNNHKNVLIGWGTDVSIYKFREDPMKEFRLRKEYLDMSNEDILKQATIDSAKIIHKEDQIGSIKEGKFADFVVVDGNPAEDLSVMYKLPLHVIKGGQIIR